MIPDICQNKAIKCSVNQSFFIKAPAGHGKTHVITERIKYLISGGYLKPPKKILAITFSNAAASEMEERIKRKIPEADKYVDIMNFHTFAYRLLRVYGNKLDINRNFTIKEEDSEKEFMKSYFEKKGVSNVFDEIETYKVWWRSLFFLDKGIVNKEYNNLRLEFEGELKKRNELTFDYILLNCLLLLRKVSYINNAIFNRYEFIVADEFQDTNSLQYLIFKEIAMNRKENRNVFVVGDKKQSIMKFQGATPENIDYLISDFSCEEISLKNNYRASEKIVTLTDRLRGLHNSTEFKFKMFISEDIENENENIIKVVEDLVQKGEKLHDICILFPINNAPNKLKKELKGKFDYFCINDFKQIKKSYPLIFQKIQKKIQKRVAHGSVNKLVKNIIKKDYSDEFKDGDVVLTTLEKFSKNFDKGDYKTLEYWKRLNEFYNYLEIEMDWAKIIKTKIKDKLFLSTIHSAKGLEFKFVIIFGIGNYRVPFASVCFNECKHNKNYGKIDISEYKDLFYVGVSRSIEEIFFFFCLTDEINKKNRKISCVFKEISDLLICIDDQGDEYDFEDQIIQNIFCPN